MEDIENARHTQERGTLVRVLKENYQEEMTSIQMLIRMLDRLNIPLSYEGMVFHLHYLEDGGYLKLWRARDLPNFRRDRTAPGSRKPGDVMFAKLLPKGLQLLDGRIPEDPQVTF